MSVYFASSEEIYEQYGIRAVRPLADATMKRIARGVQKFVLENPHPFVVRYKFNYDPEDTERPLSTITAVNSHYLAMPTLIQYHSEQSGDVRGQSVEKPLMTVDSSNRYGLVSTFVTQFNHFSTGQDVREP